MRSRRMLRVTEIWSEGSRSMNSRACGVVGCSNFNNILSEGYRSINSRACAVVGCSKVTEMWSEALSLGKDANGQTLDVSKLSTCVQRALGL
jgi:hypothetical protein